MTQREIILNFLEKNPEWKQRKYRYLLAAELTGIEPEVCKQIASILDDYRHITQVDEIGEEKAEEWKRTPNLIQFGDKISKRYLDDLTRFA